MRNKVVNFFMMMILLFFVSLFGSFIPFLLWNGLFSFGFGFSYMPYKEALVLTFVILLLINLWERITSKEEYE